MSEEFNNNVIPSQEPVPSDNVASETPVQTNEFSQPAFDYQPPQVEVPQLPVTEVQQPVQQTYQAPQPNVYQQPVQQTYQAPQPNVYQQPVQQTYQAPQPNVYQQPVQQTYQAPQPNVYQQPVQQAYQAPQPNAYQQPVQQMPQNQQAHTTGYYQYTPVDPALVNSQDEVDGFGIASTVLGSIGLLSCCTFFFSLLGLIFGIISKTRNDGSRSTTWSTVGIILSAIGLLMSIFFWALVIFGE